MFQFPASAPTCVDNIYLYMLGCPIRISPDQWLFAPPRSFSQLITSFFASKSQGIPCAPLVTYSFFTRFFFLLAFEFSFLSSFCFSSSNLSKNFEPSLILVEDNGFEPMTPCVQGRCSSQLS